MVRLDKFLAEMGKGTRSEIKKYIKQGRVRVNDKVVKAADLKIDPDSCLVTFDNVKVAYEEYVYYMLNKPITHTINVIILNTDTTLFSFHPDNSKW